MELLGVHPTVKPMLMIVDALKDVSRRGDLVFDPFLGSGSTLLAAEETGRICLGVELDPGYVEVAIRRWEKRTRRDAVHADTGQTFSLGSRLRATTTAISTLNRLPQEAGWDDGALRCEFRELLSLGFDIELTGFEAAQDLN
jgi:hypothetical protein